MNTEARAQAGDCIYILLERHGWRLVVPGGKRPKKASDEDIEASKKLTLDSGVKRALAECQTQNNVGLRCQSAL